MRKRIGSLQISLCRLLSLLLIHVLIIFAVPAVTGLSSSPDFHLSLEKYKDRLTGGNSFVSTYVLMSRCSNRFVRMTPSKKVEATAIDRNDRFAHIRFKSIPGEDGAIQIQGDAVGRYLCFSRRGRPLIRYNGKSERCRFHEIPDPTHGYTYIRLKSVVKDWYLGFNRRGKRIRGYSNRRRRRRKCYLFTKIPVSPPSYRHKINPYGPFRGLDPSKISTLNDIGKR